LTVALEFERRLEDLPGFTGRGFDAVAVAGIERLSGLLEQGGLVVEEIHLARAAVHEQLDHAADPGAGGGGNGGAGEKLLTLEEAGEARGPESTAEATDELASGDVGGSRTIRRGIHGVGFS
jgi:hypothetical protein